MKITQWKVDIRDPYCGGWVPLIVIVAIDPTKDGGAVVSVQVENTERFVSDAKPITDV